MLKRTNYLELIEEIRNTEKKSMDEYIWGQCHRFHRTLSQKVCN